jgi:DtxR family Mn-dependent transcriptional regulator
MRTSHLEDVLEAILLLGEDDKTLVLSSSIAQHLSMDESRLEKPLKQLLSQGKVVSRDGGLELTDAGRRQAERIVRKHKTLECFFTEMLGMDREFASQEACKLEHEVSDETIERLSTYITRPSHHPGRRWMRGKRQSVSLKTVLDFDEGAQVVVVKVRGLGWNRRLIDLGIVPGEQLVIRRKLRNRTIVVQVKGCDVVLSPEAAQTIFVE